jgi:ADP-ribosyl-[dinitrogen reductase] hydrolase
MIEPNELPLAARAQGCLLGLACGNALGIPYQDVWPAAKILETSHGSVREIDPNEALLSWDDDTAQAVAVAEELIETGRMNLRSLGKRLVQWRQTNGRGIPTLVDRVLDEIEGEIPVEEASEDAFQRLGRNWSANNAAVVRAIPIALKFSLDPDKIAAETVISAKVTHWNPLCVWSAVALNLGIATILRGEPLHLAALAEQVRGHGAPDSVCDAVAASRAPLSMFLLDGKAKSYTLKAMQVGLWALLTEGALEDLLEAVILEGGDTDTNAAIAGAALGARHGRQAIPERWLESIHEPARIIALADALVA